MPPYITSESLHDRFGDNIDVMKSSRWCDKIDYDILISSDKNLPSWSVLTVTVFCSSRTEWFQSKRIKVKNSLINEVFDFIVNWMESAIYARR